LGQIARGPKDDDVKWVNGNDAGGHGAFAPIELRYVTQNMKSRSTLWKSPWQ
jgi:hypothetical protein